MARKLKNTSLTIDLFLNSEKEMFCVVSYLVCDIFSFYCIRN